MAVTHLKTNEFDEFISCGNAIVDFWAAWCGPCRMQAPILDRLDMEMGDQVRIGKVDVDEEPELARRFGIMSIPTVIAFRGGKEADRSVGVTALDELKGMVK